MLSTVKILWRDFSTLQLASKASTTCRG